MKSQRHPTPHTNDQVDAATNEQADGPASGKAAAGKATRDRTVGSLVGAVINQLLAINEAEENELADFPQAIRERAAKKRETALSKLDANQRDAAVKAAEALRPQRVDTTKETL